MPIEDVADLYPLDEAVREAGIPSLFSCDNPDFEFEQPFHPCHVIMVLDASYQRRLPKPGVNVWSVDQKSPGAGFGPLDRLRVVALLGRRVTRVTRNAFARVLRTWAESTADREVLGESPVSIVDDRLIFDGLAAEFHVDMRHAGVATLNWLVLSLLEFGREIVPVQGIILGERLSAREFERHVLGIPAGRPTVLTVSTALPKSIEPPDGEYPPEAIPDATFRSDRFEILIAPPFIWEDEWDKLQARVYFATTPPDSVFSEMKAVLRSYLTVGRYGALGRGVIGRHSEILVDGGSGSAYFTADMGGAEPHVAIPLLIRLLEEFNPKYFPIDAILFGSSKTARGRETPNL